jgi:GNAT superfamily N-acetyltransferase
MDISVRPATADDAVAACAAMRRSIAECCSLDHHNDSAVVDAWLRNKTADNTKALIEAPENFCVVAVVDGSITGFGMARAGKVLLCYAVPEVHQRGVGKSMLQAMEAHAIGGGAITMRLESTRTALAFYTRNGYVPVGAAVNIFGMEGQPMAKSLPARAPAR